MNPNPNPMKIEAIMHNRGDDVAVAVASDIGPGSMVGVWNMENDESRQISVTQAIPVGHKIALQDIAAGAAVIKYGVPIGTATGDIRAGEHVHIHNLRSNRW